MTHAYIGFQVVSDKKSLVQVVLIEAQEHHLAQTAWDNFLLAAKVFDTTKTTLLVQLPSRPGTVSVDTSEILGVPTQMVCAVEWILPGHYTVMFTVMDLLKSHGKPLHVEKLELKRGSGVMVSSFFELNSSQVFRMR